jgi:hypothetical protein
MKLQNLTWRMNSMNLSEVILLLEILKFNQIESPLILIREETLNLINKEFRKTHPVLSKL